VASPVVANQWPVPNEEYAHPRGTVYLEITDADNDLVAGSVIIKLNGVTVWSGDAQQNNYAVTKTAITNGFSYEVQPPEPWGRASSVLVDTYADDGVNPVTDQYVFRIGVAKYLLFQDLFNDGAQNARLTYDPNNGVITETGGELKLDGPDSLNCDWWTSVANAPKVYAAIPSLVHEYPAGVLMVESRLSNYAESAANVSFGGGPMLYNDDQNVYFSGFYDYVNDIRFERGISNSFSSRYNSGDGQVHPSTTAHRYRILWNNTGRDVTVDGKTFLKGVVYFWYSTDDGVTWVEAFNEAMALPRPQNFGVWFKKFNAGAYNAQAYIDYLELWELLPDPEVKSIGEDRDAAPGPKGLFSDDVDLPTQSGDGTRHTYPAQPDGVTLVEDWDVKEPQPKALFQDSVAFPTQSGDNKLHKFPEQPEGVHLSEDWSVREPQPKALFQDAARHYLGIDTTYQIETLDSEGHQHFIGRRAIKAFLYDAKSEAALWTTPTNPAFTGYGRDGYEYIAGVQQAGGPHAPWALETASVDRSSRASFPDRVLIVHAADGENNTPAEIVIFDLDNYPTNLDVWMRFRFAASGATYYMMGRVNQKPTNIRMVNGVLVISTSEGDYRGGLHIVDFKATGQDCGHHIRSDNHFKWNGTIATRNTTGWTTSGVSPSLRINPESVYSISMHIDEDDPNRLWLAWAGEDTPVEAAYIDSSVPKKVYVGSGAQGSDNAGNVRQVFFDPQGWLWFSVDNWVYRTLQDYKEGMIHAPSDDLWGRGISNRVKLLPNFERVIWMAFARDYIYAYGYPRGIYAIDRGTMEAHLAYTGAGDSGGGMANNPPDGELILGQTDQLSSMDTFDVDLASYLVTSVRLGGGASVIRMLDDKLTDSKEFPDLHMPSPWFHIPLLGIT
jgi:hypothetical protein